MLDGDVTQVILHLENMIMQGRDLTPVSYTHLKDRLLGLGFELVEYIASLYNCEIEIIDNTEKSEQTELVEDLVQVITLFSCKLQGKRANKANKLVQELIEEEKNNGKRRKGNVRT